MPLTVKKIHQKRAVLVGLEEGERFINARSAMSDSCKSFSKEDIRKLPWIPFTLKEVFITQKTHFDDSKISSRMLIQQLLGKKKAQKFRNLSVIIHIILTAYVKISVESAVEPFWRGTKAHHAFPTAWKRWWIRWDDYLGEPFWRFAWPSYEQVLGWT